MNVACSGMGAFATTRTSVPIISGRGKVVAVLLVETPSLPECLVHNQMMFPCQ